MDMYTHTLLAVGCLAVAYYGGVLSSRSKAMEFVVANMLQKLEDEGFIRTKLDRDGEKEIIPISEIERNGRT